MGWQMVRHAFGMVFGNFSQALRASAAPMVIGVLLTIVAFKALGVDMAMLRALESGEVPQEGSLSAIFAASIFLMAVYLFVFGWVAVTWHRYVLLEDYPAVRPALGDRPIGAYAGKAFLIGLVVVLAAIPLMLILGLVVAPFAMAGGTSAALIAGVLLGLVLGTALTWLWYRFAVVLPGTAIGKPLALGDGWSMTKPVSGAIFKMALILVGFNVAVTLILSPISLGMPIVGQIISLVINWITLMVGVSILTTLYGHLVEGRSLAD